MWPSTWHVPAAVALTLVVTTTGCGLGTQKEPMAVPIAQLPSAQSSDGAQTGILTNRRRGLLYVARGDALEAVLFTLEQTTVTGRIRALLSIDRLPAGLRTAIPAGTRLLGVERSGSVVTLVLSEELLRASDTEQQLAMAQLVYTATEVPDTAAIRVKVNGRIIALPDRNGRLVTRPLTRRDVDGPLPMPD